LDGLRSEIEGVSVRGGEIREKISEYRRRLADFEAAKSSFEDEQRQHRELHAARTQLEERRRRVNSELEKVKRDREAVRRSMREVGGKRKSFEAEAAQRSGDFGSLGEREEEMRRKVAELEGGGRELAGEIERLREAKRQFEAEKEKLKAELAANRRIEELKKKVVKRAAMIVRLKVSRSGKEATMESPYLKKVLLQFFLQDPSARDSLVAVILGLVGCTEEEVRVAHRKWNESHQLVSRSFLPF
jgi:chromosome segregation ATPase